MQTRNTILMDFNEYRTNKFGSIHKNRTWIWIVLVFLSILLIRFPLAAFMKHAQTYEDEWLYYTMAESLARGKGFPVIYYGVSHYERVLYSLLISPAFLTYNRSLQFQLIDLINTLCLSSGVFPAYLLAKELLADKKTALACAVIYALLPDQAMNITFMCDSLFLTLSLWVLYFGRRVLDWEAQTRRKQIGSLVGFGLFWIAACYTKKAGVIYGVVLVLAVLIKWIVQSIQNRRFHLLLLSIFIVVIAGIWYLLGGNSSLSLSVRRYISIAMSELIINKTAFTKEYIYNLLSDLVAVGVFPIALPLICFDRLSSKAKYFLLYLTGCLLAFNFGVTYASITKNVRTACLRYVCMFWIPYFILFFASMQSEDKYTGKNSLQKDAVKNSGEKAIPQGRPLREVYSRKTDRVQTNHRLRKQRSGLWELVGWVGFFIICFTIALRYYGVELTDLGLPPASVDYTMLCWAENWSSLRLYYGAAFISAVFILTALLYASRKAFLIVFFVVWGGLQIYNNAVITDRLRGEYELSEADAEEVLKIDDFVRQNPESTFLILETGTIAANSKVTFSSKLSDTFLNHENTLRVTLNDLYRMQQGQAEGSMEIDLEETALPVWRGDFAERFYPIQSVEYLVVPLDSSCYPDPERVMETDLGEGNWYRVYQLKDPNILPILYTPEALSNPAFSSGRLIFTLDPGRKHIEPGFLSEYMDENENAVHTSGKDPGYALFGPGITLSPGEYTISILLSNTEYPDDIVIGFTELSSSNMNLHNTMRDFHQGTACVTYHLNLTEACEGFQTQVYTWVPGVTVESIEIEYSMPKTDN